MCLICIDLDRQKLSSKEARRNLGEVYTTMETKHVYEVIKKIWRQEDKEYKDFEKYIKTCDI
jgi:hypothetical protein